MNRKVIGILPHGQVKVAYVADGDKHVTFSGFNGVDTTHLTIPISTYELDGKEYLICLSDRDLPKEDIEKILRES
ncbi:hypothetical protein [Cronobacter sp. JZ38]|uniref:hypothetical protein n=1 Tax=Cronobacter sp. JZ38 TaxID=1906275 RepID=UPI0012A33E1B|nr:hypothetical protein [Cronobacter sp. JZ38]